MDEMVLKSYDKLSRENQRAVDEVIAALYEKDVENRKLCKSIMEQLESPRPLSTFVPQPRIPD